MLDSSGGRGHAKANGDRTVRLMRLLGGNGRAPGPSGALSRVAIPTSVSKGAKKVRRQQRRRFAGGEGQRAPRGWHSRPICQKRHLSRVGSLVLRFARASHHTTSPPRDMNRQAGAGSIQRLFLIFAASSVCASRQCAHHRSRQRRRVRGREEVTAVRVLPPSTSYHPHGISQSIHPKTETTTNHAARAMASTST